MQMHAVRSKSLRQPNVAKVRWQRPCGMWLEKQFKSLEEASAFDHAQYKSLPAGSVLLLIELDDQGKEAGTLTRKFVLKKKGKTRAAAMREVGR